MSRPLSAPPFPQSPETWLAYFRHRADLVSDRHYSPEVIGEQLGVSGATVRRWEKGKAAPTDEDLVRFAKLCGLSQHQLAFLLIAFKSSRAPLPPDPVHFRANTEDILSRRAAPMVLMDELMYVRAWNSYMPLLGEQAGILLDRERHPLECFLEHVAPAEGTPAAARLRKAVRSFWRFSAHASNSREYCNLVDRLHDYPRFGALWADLAECNDPAPIDIFGVAELILPEQGPAFSVVHSVSVYPPVYSVFEYQAVNDDAAVLLCQAQDGGAPRVSFSARDHWASPVASISQV